MKKQIESPQEAFDKLFNDVQRDQGYGFCDEVDVESWGQLLEYCEQRAYHSQCATNIIRGMARTCRKRIEQQ